MLQAMRAVKRVLDPHNIRSPENMGSNPAGLATAAHIDDAPLAGAAAGSGSGGGAAQGAQQRRRPLKLAEVSVPVRIFLPHVCNSSAS